MGGFRTTLIVTGLSALFAGALVTSCSSSGAILSASDAHDGDGAGATDASTASDAEDVRDARDERDAPALRDGGDAAGDAAAQADASRDATADATLPICQNDLSQVGTGDFHVSLTLATTQGGVVAIANQRATCTHGKMWDLHLLSGAVAIETDDGSSYTALQSAITSNDGAPHAVVVTRTAGTLTISIDGVVTASAASLSSFGALPPMQIGGGVCDGVGGVTAFSGAKGSLEDLCVATP